MKFHLEVFFMPYYVYILQSLKDYKYYIGSSFDVNKLLQFHNSKLQRSTKHRTPFIIVFTEECFDKVSALKEKSKLKVIKEAMRSKN